MMQESFLLTLFTFKIVFFNLDVDRCTLGAIVSSRILIVLFDGQVAGS